MPLTQGQFMNCPCINYRW